MYLLLIAIIVLIIMLAEKVRVAYPVLLVLAGLGISLIPGIPSPRIGAELIFIIFLPPLLYEASWSISWKELWKWRRIITSFAFIVVFFTAMSVAFAANYFIPGFSLALGFLLGGIVSPPDAVSAGAILKFVKVPRRFSSILEGESLLNDASSLIVFRFALITVAIGQFIWHQAALSFGWMIIGGMGIGLAVGWLIMQMHKRLPTDANTDLVLTLLTPYAMYILAEEVHSSGVLAVVSGGLLLSYKRLGFLNSSSRLRGVNVWESLCFILNGLVFMLIGLELPEITRGLNETGIDTAIGYGLLITLVLVVARMVSAFSAVVVTLVARNFITVADSRNPGIRGPFVLGWSGMRGVVSLAAALSIPTHLEDGTPFPQRNLILFITFVVILTTLVVQGLSLPWLIRKMHIEDPDYIMPEEELYNKIRRQLSDYAVEQLHHQHGEALRTHPGLMHIAKKLEASGTQSEYDVLFDEVTRDAYRNILNLQRQWLHEKNRHPAIDEEIIRKHLMYLDLEEEKLALL